MDNIYICYEYDVVAEVKQKDRRATKRNTFRVLDSDTEYKKITGYPLEKILKKKRLTLIKIEKVKCVRVAWAFHRNLPDMPYLTAEELAALPIPEIHAETKAETDPE